MGTLKWIASTLFGIAVLFFQVLIFYVIVILASVAAVYIAYRIMTAWDNMVNSARVKWYYFRNKVNRIGK